MKNFRILNLLCALALSCLVLFAGPAMAERSVTDQLGRTVTIPDVVNRAVILQHQTLDIAIQLGAADSVVGILEKWEKYLPGAAKSIKNIENMPTPGGLKSVNMETLLTLNPDIVFVTHYAPKDMIEQITTAGIPVVAITLYNAGYEQASVLNPELKDASKAYNDGLKEGINIIADIFSKQQKAEKLIAVINANQKILKSHLGTIEEAKRVRCYMARSNLRTYGRGKYTSVIMERAGGVNVAAAEIVGFKEVSMEDVLRWNPEVIFVQWRHRKVAKDLTTDPIWKQINAVKNNKVFICPEYVKPWGHALPESMALGELWMAKTLYPEKFKDVDLSALVQSYYKEFYGVSYK
ncbi:ABC transporter substrate-binding protein [Maridesulfovibrio frigidus]|uniref:ABC transporter substrate-binding protein n=1 Tax=Maridesulfovibrio frigidus TaxID=340956 RepID=UPI000556A6D2|nr:ABC transporter substrate-binding protein [Maridesulfovibrio frigidus]